MQDPLCTSELFPDIAPEFQPQLSAVAHRQSLHKGEYLFLLGDHADRIYVVLEGAIEVCFPLSLGGAVKDIAVDTIGPGKVVGLSALVKPYRLTLSARAAEKTELAAFVRVELMNVIDSDARIGRAFMGRLAEVLGRRYLTIQALWGRELQRSLASQASSKEV